MISMSLAQIPAGVDFECASVQAFEDADDLDEGEMSGNALSGYAPEPMKSLKSMIAPPQQSMPSPKRRERSITGTIAASRPMKQARGFFRKHDAANEQAP